MNKHKSDQDNDKKKESQVSVELDDGVVELPISTFNDILEREINNFLENQTNEEDIIELNDVNVNVQDWKKKYESLENEYKMLNSIVNLLKSELKTNKFAQPKRCLSASFNQHVGVSLKIERKMAKVSEKKHPMFIISDSEDDLVKINNTQNLKNKKRKPASKSKKNVSIPDLKTNDNNNVLPINNKAGKTLSNGKCLSTTIHKRKHESESVDLDNNTQNLTDKKCKPASKSKINVSIPDLKTNDNNKVLPINNKASKSLSNGKCLSTTIHKRKHESESVDLDNNTQNLKDKKCKPASKSKINVSIPDLKTNDNNKVLPINNEAGKSLSNGKCLSTTIHKRKHESESVDLDNNTQNLTDKKCKPASKSKINVSIPDLKTNDNNKLLPINNEAGKTLSNGESLSTTIHKQKHGPESVDLDNNTQNLKDKKCKLASKSKINVSIPDVKTNDNNKVLPINNESGKTLSNGECLSTTIHKQKHGPESVDLDNNTQNLKDKKCKPASKSKINVSILDLKTNDNNKVLPINNESGQTLSNGECLSTTIHKQKHGPESVDLDNNTQNLKDKKCKPASKSKINVSIPDLKTNDNNKVLPINNESGKTLSNGECLSTTIHKQKHGPESVDLDNNTQNLTDKKCKPASKSKINVSIPDLKTNDNNKVLPINNESGKTLNNGECLSTTIRKRKPGPKSKTMFFSDTVPVNAEDEETVEKKKCLNVCEVINNKESNTKKLLSSNSVKKLEVPERYKYSKYNYYKKPSHKYPPPYPVIPPHHSQPSWKKVPPIPNMKISTSGNNVTLTWDLNLTSQIAKIKMYELFVCQETDALPNITMWKKKGEIEADLLPMACVLEVFDLGYTYHFALRAVDIHDRRAPFAVLETTI